MRMCDETVTFVHHIRTPDGDSYQCIPISGVSWYAQTAVVPQDKGLKTSNILKCRIPAERLPHARPQTTDFMVRGIVTEIQKSSDLKACGLEYFTITGVSDNRRGKNPHWAVSGA